MMEGQCNYYFYRKAKIMNSGLFESSLKVIGFYSIISHRLLIRFIVNIIEKNEGYDGFSCSL